MELAGDEATGRNIVLRALEEPVRQIAHNAGFGKDLSLSIIENAEVGTGLMQQLANGLNMIDQGIIDPVKVSRSTYKCSICSQLDFDYRSSRSQ